VSRPGRSLPPGKSRYPLYRRMGGTQGRSGQVRKISSPTGIRSPDRPPRSQSLYRLNYRAHGRLGINVKYSIFWVIPLLLNLYTDISEHPVCSIFITLVHTTQEDGADYSETSANKMQTPENNPEDRIQHCQQGEICNK